MQTAVDIQVNAQLSDKIRIVEVTGDLNYRNIPELSEVLVGLIDKNAKNIIIDFSRITHIDSAGIGILIKYARKADNEDFELVIAGCSEQLLTLFKPINLNKLIKIFKTVEEGVAYFQSSVKTA